MFATGLERGKWTEEEFRRLTGQHQEASWIPKLSEFSDPQNSHFSENRFYTWREKGWIHHLVIGL